MVAPVSRTTIFIGKTFGGMTTSLMQAAILLVVGLFLRNQLHSIFHSAYCFIILFLSFALTSLGLALGSYMESLEGFQLIVSFVVFPLYFLSGALFPLNNLPSWLSYSNQHRSCHLCCGCIRNTMVGITGKNPFVVDIGILAGSVIALGTIGMLSFRRMKAV